MPLSPGDKLGPYEILALIGKGGMGEVFRAHDDRLRRDVAIKVSNDQFTDRFTREARAIASLNHTNICHLYDVGPDYLVMEYVEGEDLKGPMSFDDALPIIQQLIDGIEAAHEKNIIHRDLKPANIKITPEGVVKILDFGLAKAMEPPTSQDADPNNSPTLTMGATAVGAILGTAAYMAPEQAKGKPADKRSDIWSFGVILYELLSGQRLFQGETAVEILGGVLNKDLDISAAPASVHPLLRWCLEKDRKQRLQAIGDARRMLSQSGDEPAAPPERLPAQSRLPWVAAVAASAVALGIGLWSPWRAPWLAPWLTTPSEDRPLVRLDVDLGEDVSLPPSNGGRVGHAISPDGMRLAYISGTPGRLFTRRLDQPKATELPGTQGAIGLVFSSDGQWIVFHAENKLNKISVEGGAVVPLGEINNWAGSSWEADGSLVVSQAFTKGIWRIPAGGGPPQTIAELGKGELALTEPQVLPGGKAILFTSQTGSPDQSAFQVLSLADGKRKTVGHGGTSVRFIPASEGATRGHLIYVNGPTLFAAAFDLAQLEIRGTPVPVLDDVAFYPLSGRGQFDFSLTGTFVYRRVRSSGMMSVQWVSPGGKQEPAGPKPAIHSPPPTSPSISPDGKRMALTLGRREREGSDIWIYDSQRDSVTRLTFSGGGTANPIWSPDGQYVVYTAAEGLFQARADGARPPQPLLPSQPLLSPSSFTQDGKRLIYNVVSGSPQLWTMPLEEQGGQLKAGKPEPLPTGSAAAGDAALSPDGHWLAYQSGESGIFQVYVRAFSSSSLGTGRWQISTVGGQEPHWSRNGDELVYRRGDQLMTVNYAVEREEFVAGKPRVWIEKLGSTQWDLAPDGKRVLALIPVQTEAPRQEHEIVMLQNFFDELRRKVPLGE